MKSLIAAVALLFTFSNSYADDRSSRVVTSCTEEYGVKSNPNPIDKFLIECIDNHIKDLSYLDDQNELISRGTKPGVKQTKAEAICTTVKKIAEQITDIEGVLNSASGMAKMVGSAKLSTLKNGFNGKFGGLNCP